jgi:transcriptional regulator with XRE-family HTH domain
MVVGEAMVDERVLQQFGQDLRRRREEQNLTLEQFAERAELTPGYIGSIENGRRDPSLSTIIKLAHGLDVSVGALLGKEIVISPEGLNYARLFEEASPQIQAGQLMILREVAEREPLDPWPLAPDPKEPDPKEPGAKDRKPKEPGAKGRKPKDPGPKGRRPKGRRPTKR